MDHSDLVLSSILDTVSVIVSRAKPSTTAVNTQKGDIIQQHIDTQSV